MANVTCALLQPLATQTKPQRARLALDCAPLPKEKLYISLSKPQAQRKPEGEQHWTGFCHGSSGDVKHNFYFQILNVLTTTLGKQRELFHSVRSHALLGSRKTNSVHNKLESLSLLSDIPQLSVPPSSSKGCNQIH